MSAKTTPAGKARDETSEDKGDKAAAWQKSRDPLGGSTYDRIRAAISSGHLKPGERVTEAGLAKWLSVSRTPVREAIFRLESEGLLTRLPRQGLTVRQLNYQEVVELYAMREVLEGTAARFAASHASEAEIDTLADIVASERASPPPDPKQAAQLNKQFHSVIYRAAHNRYLLESLRALGDAMTLLGSTTLALPGRHSEALDEHDAIVAAIRARDADAAEAAARAHIKAAKRNRIRIILQESA